MPPANPKIGWTYFDIRLQKWRTYGLGGWQDSPIIKKL